MSDEIKPEMVDGEACEEHGKTPCPSKSCVHWNKQRPQTEVEKLRAALAASQAEVEEYKKELDMRNRVVDSFQDTTLAQAARAESAESRVSELEAALAASEAECERLRESEKDWYSKLQAADETISKQLAELENDRDRLAKEMERLRLESAAALGDLLLEKYWKESIEMQGIDCRGLLSQALDKLHLDALIAAKETDDE